MLYTIRATSSTVASVCSMAWPMPATSEAMSQMMWTPRRTPVPAWMISLSSPSWPAMTPRGVVPSSQRPVSYGMASATQSSSLLPPGHLGHAVHRGGRYLIDVRGEVQAERPAQGLTSLLGGDGGQGGANDVAGREDPRAARPPLGVDDDATARVYLDAGLLQAEARGADAAARREQQRVRAQLTAVGQLREQVVAVPAHRSHGGAEDHPVTPRPERLLEAAGDLAVHHRGQPGSAVEDRDGHAQRGEDGGVLDPDRAAPDDQQLTWLARDIRDGLRVEDARIAEGHAGRAERARSGGDDDAFGAQPGLLAVVPGDHRVVAIQPRRATHQAHAAGPDPLQCQVPEPLADLVGPRQHRRVHHLRRHGQRDTVDSLLLERAEVQSRLTERLGRRTPIGDHRAADRVPLDQRDRISKRRGEQGRRLAGRARADHHHIKVALRVSAIGRHQRSPSSRGHIPASSWRRPRRPASSPLGDVHGGRGPQSQLRVRQREGHTKAVTSAGVGAAK